MIKKINLIFLTTLLFIIFIEILFLISWKLSGSKYFENRKNNIDRIERTTDIKFNLLDTKSKHNKTIALFGGSTIRGFGSAVNIEELIYNKNFLSENYFLYSNFSKYGHSFSGHQYKILKQVINDYDLFFLYSAHNEWRMVHKFLDSEKKGIKTFPNGMSIGTKNSVNPTNEEIKNYIKEHTLDYNFFENILINYKLYSRIYFFSVRVANRINFFNFTKKAEDKKDLIIKQFIFSENLFNSKMKEQIVNHYKESIFDIIKSLTKDQKLVISTVLSNDLFNPFGDYNISNKDENNIKLAYEKLDENNFLDLEIITNKLQDGSNKFYLLGRICLDRFGYKINSDSSKCFELLKKARGKDTMPFRVLPEINDFIRSLSKLKNLNVEVIDLEKEFLKKVESEEDYLSYFVDFHHLSPKGHLLLSKLLFEKLNITSKNVDLDKLNTDRCGSVKIINEQKNVEKNLIDVPFERCKWTLLTTQRLLKSHMRYQKYVYYYKYFLNKSLF